VVVGEAVSAIRDHQPELALSAHVDADDLRGRLSRHDAAVEGGSAIDEASYHRAVLANLHCHLDGSVRSATLRELAAAAGRAVPEDLLFTQRMGLEAALARFAFTLALLAEPETVMRVAREICEDAFADGVTTLEIRFAPQLHTGGAIEAIVDAALSGIASGPVRAGLVLCGLYGEPLDLVLRLVEVARTRPGVVGIDLAGGPSPAHSVRLEDYAPAFRRAADLGLGRTVHAGEGRPPSEIRTAIETLLAQRIGHGTTLLDDERVADLVVERGVVIEACPTSNVHTGVIASVADHPLPRWLARGVLACVNPDNTLLSDVSASQEHERARAIPGLTQALLDEVIATGHRAAFVR
jgi:adenosine deaminase